MKFRTFLGSFIKTKGVYVLFSLVFTKVFSFTISFIAIRLLLKDDFGNISYANSIISFIVPFMGMGAFQGLIRYGARLNSDKQKLELFNYSLKRGILLTFFICIVLWFIVPVVSTNMPGSAIYFKILIFQIIGLTFFEFIKSYFRLIHKNNLYALWDIIYYSSLLIIVVILIKIYGAVGYVLALTFTPFVISIIIIIKYKLLKFEKTPLAEFIDFHNFWKYGLIVSIGTVSSQILYSIDIVMLGNVLGDSNNVAIYKAAGIIPFNLRFIASAFITADYVKFAENETNRNYLVSYYLNYLKIFVPFALFIIGVFYFSRELIASFFGNGYEQVSSIIWVFAISVAANFILRVPLGNILSATKLANCNAFISVLSLVINIVLNYLFIIKYGMIGAVWATAITMWISGFIILLLFVFYIKRSL